MYVMLNSYVCFLSTKHTKKNKIQTGVVQLAFQMTAYKEFFKNNDTKHKYSLFYLSLITLYTVVNGGWWQQCCLTPEP